MAVGNPAAFHFILLALTLIFYNKNGVFQTYPDIFFGGKVFLLEIPRDIKYTLGYIYSMHFPVGRVLSSEQCCVVKYGGK